MMSYGWRKFQESRAAVDPQFCGQYREYYASFCRQWPKDRDCVKFGPEKMARCVKQ